jgi:DNA-binding HxlR family transcriptional regulator
VRHHASGAARGRSSIPLHRRHRIPANFLTDRLARLAEFGLLEKRSHQDNPVRFA